jgi:dTDP-4-dehydrorhamnose 3,5-epimerase-like enzyme
VHSCSNDSASERRWVEKRRFFAGRARLLQFDAFVEPRGTLFAFDFSRLPFAPCRVFLVQDVPPGTTRGGHAHMHGQQLLVRLTGEIVVRLRCGRREERVVLSASDQGLLIGPGIWSSQLYRGEQAALMVMASEPYDADAYLEAQSRSDADASLVLNAVAVDVCKPS